MYVAHSCFPFEIGPEHSPVLSYVNLTEDEENIFGQIEASYTLNSVL